MSAYVSIRQSIRQHMSAYVRGGRKRGKETCCWSARRAYVSIRQSIRQHTSEAGGREERRPAVGALEGPQ
jgi:hypothetical protein